MPLLGAVFSKRSKLNRAREKEIEILRRSPLLDPVWYRQTYADLRRAPIDVARHYLEHGAREGRNPSAHFDTTSYLEQHPDLVASGMNPLVHYILRCGDSVAIARGPERATAVDLGADVARGAGVAQTMKIVAGEFDADFYLRSYSDVKDAEIDPLRHYVEHGWREGRNPNALFWTTYYVKQNRDVEQSGLNPFAHFLTSGRLDGRKPNPIGRVLWERPSAPADADWGAAHPAKDVPCAELVVIMPVYQGAADTLAAIFSVLTNPQRTAFELLVINDRGPDEALNARLRDLAALGLFAYLENQQNLGFSGAINRGLSHRPDRDVILLNSDTVVYGDWIDRMRAHARNDDSVATVTPFSNNATICSYPDVEKNNLIGLEVSPAELDQFARECNRGRSSVLPTGVGFCFYMRRDVIDKIGVFDAAAFPQGYGEENDYCMRALKAGFKNIFAHDVFVYHTGETSFAIFAPSLRGRGQNALTRRHPDFPLRIQRYFKVDPAREARMRLDLYRLARKLGRNSAVLVTQVWSGGIETHVRDLARRLTSEKVNVLLMKVGDGGALNLTLSPAGDLDLHLPSLGPILVSKFPDLISDFLGWLQPKILHVHSFAGLDWSGAAELMRIFRNAGVRYDCTLHDFTAICHRHHMVTPEGLFCGQPGVVVCRACARADPDCVDFVDPEVRRESYGAFLRGAARVFVPSRDTMSRIGRALPGLNLVVRPHEEFLPDATWPEVPETFAAPLRVAVIGAIGPHKGSGVLCGLARDARERALPIEFSIVGYSDMTDQLEGLGIKATGRYKSDSEALWQIEKLQPHIVLFPSIWPETYCYTLSLALAAGVPPVVFDIGAPAERLRESETGCILDLSLADDPSELNDALLGLPLAELWRKRKLAESTLYQNMSRDYYGYAGSQEPT
jgi:O-antigen biosynthesis protein